ncbi:MAG: response regulator transcription factor [Ruminococcaceae bacterium]|nr:response regulator transcription factor [Oscillospiraceae bacterium]
MKIVFCDDNAAALEQIRSQVEVFFRQQGGPQPELAAYTSGQALLAREQQVDIAFLDVEMPEISGIQMGVELKKRNPFVKVFIVTAYPDYLDDAMGAQVFRYLSKPVDADRLRLNLQEAVRQYHLDTRAYPVVTEDGVVVCRAEQIVCIEAVPRRVLIHTLDSVLVSTQTMEHWKNTLSLPCFYQTHRSFLVNMRFVSAIGRDKVLLKYGDRQMEAYLTRRRYSQCKDLFLQYLERVR